MPARFVSEAKIRELAEQLLDQSGVKSPPVRPEDLAEMAGARVVLESFTTDLSGVLHFVDERPVIGLNSSHPRTRQRFTLAHELGHLELHRGQTFVDRKFIFHRDQRASAGTEREEIQANMFAAELLMPREWVLRDLSEQGLDIEDDDGLQKLARRYGVSRSAMALRLANLHVGG